MQFRTKKKVDSAAPLLDAHAKVLELVFFWFDWLTGRLFMTSCDNGSQGERGEVMGGGQSVAPYHGPAIPLCSLLSVTD